MAKRKRGAPLCTINLGHADKALAQPPDPITLMCWECRLVVVESNSVKASEQSAAKKRSRCGRCGNRLVKVIELNRLTLGAVKAAIAGR